MRKKEKNPNFDTGDCREGYADSNKIPELSSLKAPEWDRFKEFLKNIKNVNFFQNQKNS